MPSASAAATEVHTGKNTWPTRVLSAGDTLKDSSKKDVPAERGVVSENADEDPTREGWCGGGSTRRFSDGAAGINRRAGADDGLEGFVLKRILHFDASADR